MSKILSYCGYRCDLCPAYVKNLDKLVDRKTVSKKWKKYFGFDIPPNEILCVGCKNEGIHADKDCPIRPCIIKKKLKNCSECKINNCEKPACTFHFCETHSSF